ncbi:hypothetical protein GXN78_28510 [Variovorax sp. WS11]|nr:hypothetical protein [Variovorax sp. WS11]NDZ16751.1 hypothetical protein [Variovorax sp. WS11]
MRYRFHPLVGGSLAVVRVHDVCGEPCYVIRRHDGTTVSVPAWMTELSAGDVQIVEQSRLPLATLLELRRWVSTFLSSRVCTNPTGERDAATPDGPDSAVRRRRRATSATTAAGRSDPSAAADGAVDASRRRGDQQGRTR